MRNYIYKIIIAAIVFIIVFEFTIGKTLNKITKQTDLIVTKEGRKKMVNSIKKELEKAVNKENYLDQEERLLINKFLKKIKNELDNVN